MNETERDAPLKTLVKSIEANMYSLTPFFYDWPGADKCVEDDLSWCVTDIPFPWCNVAFNARLEKKRADSAIKDFAEAGRKRGVPVCWWISSDTAPSDLARRLKKQGFVKRSTTTLMALDLYNMRDDMAGPRDLVVEQAEGKRALSLWCSVAAAGFAIPPSAEPFLVEWLSTAINLGLPIQFFLGRVRGLPVATALLFLAGGVAGLYFVTTVPAARCQGIGRSLTLAPLREARKMGYSVGVLQASRMGESIYRRIGFRPCGTMMSYIRMHGVS